LRLALAFTKHGLKMPVLVTTLFGPQFSFSEHFEQRNCSLPRFFCMTQFLTISFKWLRVIVHGSPNYGQRSHFIRPAKIFCQKWKIYTRNICWFDRCNISRNNYIT